MKADYINMAINFSILFLLIYLAFGINDLKRSVPAAEQTLELKVKDLANTIIDQAIQDIIKNDQCIKNCDIFFPGKTIQDCNKICDLIKGKN